MSWLEQAAQLTIILSFVGGVCGTIFHFVVIRPLSTSIKTLGDCVNELRTDLKTSNERLNRLEGAMERVEKAVVTAHARIDNFLHKEGDSHGYEIHDMGHR